MKRTVITLAALGLALAACSREAVSENVTVNETATSLEDNGAAANSLDLESNTASNASNAAL